MNKKRFEFRAWDSVSNKMIADFTNFAGWQGWDKGENPWRDTRYCIQQCTGIKDGNGKLIYEGDLLDICDAVVEVKWGIKFGTGWITTTVKESEWIQKKETNNLTKGFGKIIGNIYENEKLWVKNNE